jgi:hypothetical protein
VARSCERGDEPSGFTKCGEFLVDWLRNYLLFKKYVWLVGNRGWSIGWLVSLVYLTFHGSN